MTDPLMTAKEALEGAGHHLDAAINLCLPDGSSTDTYWRTRIRHARGKIVEALATLNATPAAVSVDEGVRATALERFLRELHWAAGGNYRSVKATLDQDEARELVSLLHATPADPVAPSREAIALAKFWRRLTVHFWSDEASGMDGADFQDWAKDCGLIVETTYDPNVHGANGICEPGDPWYVPTPEFAAYLKATLSGALYPTPPGEGGDEENSSVGMKPSPSSEDRAVAPMDGEIVFTVRVRIGEATSVHTQSRKVAEYEIRPLVEKAVAALAAELDDLDKCPHHNPAASVAPEARATAQSRLSAEGRSEVGEAEPSRPTEHNPLPHSAIGEGWRPIETAPKDGSRFVACREDWGKVVVVEWRKTYSDEGWWPVERHPCWLIRDDQWAKNWLWTGQVLPAPPAPVTGDDQ